MRALNFGLTRHLLRRERRYDRELRPFLQSLEPHTRTVCRFLSPQLLSIACPDNKEFVPMKAMLRDARGTPALGIELLNQLDVLERRLEHSSIGSLVEEVPYRFEVGDVVRHVEFGHIGVIAATLPVCPESDEWVVQNLGSANDYRMRHPWYLVLVARHDGLPVDFMRYGSEATHEKLAAPRSIGFHRFLPMYFKGYDATKGVYVPRKLGAGVAIDARLPIEAQQPMLSSEPRSREAVIPKRRHVSAWAVE